MKRTRIDWIVVVIATLFAFGCGGGGCGGCGGLEPIPGGFPSNARNANAGQVRVTQSALAAITADPAAVIGPLAGGGAMNGIIEFPIPASCGGDPELCCQNGQPIANCGPVEINLNKIGNEPDRLVLTPVAQGGDNGRLDVTIRARIKSKNDIAIRYQGINCTIDLDTTRDNSPPDLLITTTINFTQDPTTGTTRIQASGTQVSQLESGDYSLGGNFLCTLGGALVPASTIQDQLEGPIEDAINGATCKSCSTVADCSSPFAAACEGGECKLTAGGACLQELGINGRLRGSVVLAGISPGTTGAMDIYEVAGGYSTTNDTGISLGLLGGMLPGGAPRDRCGPPGTAPTAPTIARSAFFQGNTRPDDNSAFDVGIGLHKSQLDQLAFAGYDGGFFCLTVGSSTVAQLSTDTISLLSRSLGRLVESNSPMAIGLRPQSAPTIVLGNNTFVSDGNGGMVLGEPLLDISFQALEIDFFASIDDQYNRVFTVVTDVRLPIGLQTTGMGELTPVIGDTDNAFTNVSVKNSEAVTETPAELAALFPTLLNLVLPQLSGGLSPISLPALGGLQLSITDVTAVDNDQFLAIFADLVPATNARTVNTTAELGGIVEPPPAVARDVLQWRTARPPAVTLVLGGDAEDLEFSWRTNRGAWSAWSTNPRPTIAPDVFWLPGLHKLEVRARQIGRPETLDPTPVEIELAMGTDVPLASDGKRVLARSGFHGQAGESGCNCETGSSSGGVLLALVLGLVVVPRRRMRDALRALRSVARGARRLGVFVWLVAIAVTPGCDCGNPCGDQDCLPGEVERGAIGRWTSIAADDSRVMVATYDQVLGDLVAVDATNPASLAYVAVDGIPATTPTYDGGYRGGIAEEGPNVGAWTSIALTGGAARIAYQDRDEGALKFAYETSPTKWASYTVDAGDGHIGMYASLAFDADRRPAIAYLGVGIDDGMGRRVTELRLVRGNIVTPTAANEWSSAVIASAPGSCAGLCGSDVCVAGVNAGDPQVCATPTTDCTATCGDTEACVAGACREKFEAPTVIAPPQGTGLYVSLVVLPDGRLAAAYHDTIRRALVLAVEGTKGGNDFTETVLDGNVAGADRGMWTSAVVGDDGTIHIAYQDALGDQLMYTSWNNAPGTPVVVDDGVRAGETRTHPVGAAASIYLVGGEPAIAYQDGLVSDVYVATRAGGTWTKAPLATGPLLDGFSIAATGAGGTPVVAWGSLDPALPVPTTLVVTSP